MKIQENVELWGRLELDMKDTGGFMKVPYCNEQNLQKVLFHHEDFKELTFYKGLGVIKRWIERDGKIVEFTECDLIHLLAKLQGLGFYELKKEMLIDVLKIVSLKKPEEDEEKEEKRPSVVPSEAVENLGNLIHHSMSVVRYMEYLRSNDIVAESFFKSIDDEMFHLKSWARDARAVWRRKCEKN